MIKAIKSAVCCFSLLPLHQNIIASMLLIDDLLVVDTVNQLDRVKLMHTVQNKLDNPPKGTAVLFIFTLNDACIKLLSHPGHGSSGSWITASVLTDCWGELLCAWEGSTTTIMRRGATKNQVTEAPKSTWRVSGTPQHSWGGRGAPGREGKRLHGTPNVQLMWSN